MSQLEAPAKSPQQWGVIVSLVACLLLGGGIVYWFVFAGPSGSRTVAVDPEKQKPKSPRASRSAPPIPGITRIGENDWIARGTMGQLRIRRDGDGKFDIDYAFIAGFAPPPDNVRLIAAAHRATRDDAMAAEWTLSADQVAKLREALSSTPPPTLSAAEREELGALFQPCISGSPDARTEAQQKFVARADAIVTSKIQPAIDAMDRKMAQLRQTLTVEQIKKMTGT